MRNWFPGIAEQLFPKWFQAEVQQNPNGNREDQNGRKAVPAPVAVVGLHGKNGNHEIVRKPRMPEKRTAGWIAAAYSTDQRNGAHRQNQEGHGNIDREQRVEGESWGVCRAMEIKIAPMRSCPNETEAGLHGGAKRSFARRQLVQHPTEVERDNSPNQFGVFKWDAN